MSVPEIATTGIRKECSVVGVGVGWGRGGVIVVGVLSLFVRII